VRRNELVERLRAATASVVPITRPAGYGKTTLLAEWAERDRRPFAWVSVDEADGDPVVFLDTSRSRSIGSSRSSRACFEAIASPTGANSRGCSRASARRSPRGRRPFVLVLDDLDRLAEPLVMDAVTTIAGSVPRVRCSPGGASRPERRAPRLRADGRLVEVGVEDLALGPRQAYRLLRGAGVRATKAEAAELADATEGWPVGLYLAALSLQEQRRSTLPPIRFTATTASSSTTSAPRCSAALQRAAALPHPTSILDRLNGSVCDAVMERSGSARTLESIERQNLLLVPLDRQREWYRYHNLFRDVLRAELARREPERSRSCIGAPRTGSRKPGMLEEAFVHAHASGDEDRPPSCSNAWVSPYYRNGRSATLRRGSTARRGRRRRQRRARAHGGMIAALSGDPVAADRWASAADRGPLTGPRSTARRRSDRPRRMVHATMSRGGPDAMYAPRSSRSGRSRARVPSGPRPRVLRPRDVDPRGRGGGRRPVRRGFGGGRVGSAG
jgi:LuxR family maltose regulon positive regulatory protein